MIDISIQIVNYNTKKYLFTCIEDAISDLAGTKISYEILVIDNNSQDDLSDLEDKYKDSQVKFFYSKENKGFGAGHNFLSKKTESEYLLILNSDIEFLEKNTISRLLCEIKSNKKIKVIGPKLLTSENKPQEWDHGELRGLRAWIANKMGGSYWKIRQKVMASAWVSGAFFLIRSDIFKDVGGFDENFFLYKEEEDLCLRIRKMGGQIVYEPDVKVMHYGSVVASKDKFMNQSSQYFDSKHVGIIFSLMKKIYKKLTDK